MELSKAFWTVFEMTGSVVAYLLYRHYQKTEITLSTKVIQ